MQQWSACCSAHLCSVEHADHACTLRGVRDGKVLCASSLPLGLEAKRFLFKSHPPIPFNLCMGQLTGADAIVLVVSRPRRSAAFPPKWGKVALRLGGGPAPRSLEGAVPRAAAELAALPRLACTPEWREPAWLAARKRDSGGGGGQVVVQKWSACCTVHLCNAEHADHACTLMGGFGMGPLSAPSLPFGLEERGPS